MMGRSVGGQEAGGCVVASTKVLAGWSPPGLVVVSLQEAPPAGAPGSLWAVDGEEAVVSRGGAGGASSRPGPRK